MLENWQTIKTTIMRFLLKSKDHQLKRNTNNWKSLKLVKNRRKNKDKNKTHQIEEFKQVYHLLTIRRQPNLYLLLH